MRAIRIAAIGFGLTTSLATAQGVVVAPHAIVVDHRTRSAAITIYNPGNEPTEVTIATFYGYPVTDSTGEFELLTPTDPDPQSAASWIEAYPKRMMIGPLEKQIVRLLARPPANLPDGEYWSRIMIAAKGGKLPVATPDSGSGIQVGLNLEVRTILPLQYRKGTLRTEVGLDSLTARRVSDSVAVRVRMVRGGNAAFIGTAKGELTDQAGRVVGSFAVPIAVYRSVTPRFAIPATGLPAGRYRLALTLSTARTDLAADQLVQATPVASRIDIDLP